MDIALITYPADIDPTGVGVNVQNIVEKLIELDKQNSYYLLHFKKCGNPIYKKNEILYHHYKYLPVMFSDSMYLRNNPRRFDIVHRFSPGGFIFPIHSKIVVTVNDLFLYKSYGFNKNLKIMFARYFNRKSILKSDAVVAISEFTRNEILNTFPVDPRKVHIVHCASQIFTQPINTDPKFLNRIYGMDKKYILFVSTIEPRKNLLNLLKAYEILKEKFSIDESLVIVGKKGWDYKQTLNYIEKSNHRPSIKYIGFVPSNHLMCFYSNASIFVYPSFMEGFGIPPLEAMSCGCPTLTSNTSSLPEVMVFPEMMFDPDNVDEIVDKCFRILSDSKARQDNIRKGYENTGRFSWRKSAEKLVEIYNSLH
ncbi:glycosyltransferase family 4 protein [Thermodesulfobacteriota bacterium]